MTRRLVSTLVLCSALLNACGGGDSGSGSTATFNAAVAWRNLLTSTQAWQLNGTSSDGKAYNAGVSLTPLPSGQFPLGGNTYSRSALSVAYAANPVPNNVAATTFLFFDGSFQVQGVQQSDTPSVNFCATTTLGAALPTSATVGASGTIYNATYYPGCTTGLTSNGTAVATWSIESFNNINFFCASTTRTGTSAPGTVKICAEVGTDGTLATRARLIVNTDTLSLTATN